MLNLGVLAFADPWMLVALAGLPALWWLLRLTPPPPRRVVFPPVWILKALRRREETPARTPLWLLLLRLALAALVIVALAHPLINPGAGLTAQGPVILVVDDGWAAAPGWQRRLDALAEAINQAERQDRPVVLLPTAPPATGEPPAARLLAAGEARALAAALRPKPWSVDRGAALAALDSLGLEGPAETVWLADGIADGASPALVRRLLSLGPVQMIADPPAERARALLPPVADRDGLGLRALRSPDAGPDRLWVRATAENGAVLGRQRLDFAAGATVAEASLVLPAELRNRIVRLDIEGEASAGAVALLDERWRRRPVGIVSGESPEAAQPLLSPRYYLERALSPFSEVRTGSIDELLRRELAVIVLADIGQVIGRDRRSLRAWLEAGGTLIRFAGPRLAERSDDLVPVQLRRGGRALGGALSWAQPARLAPFAATSPFAGLAIPDDVLVRRQVLAEPTLGLAGKTWARLTDGTPLVTAERRGEGWLVLFHITADTSWTNLPLSGLFVEMLRRVVALSRGVAGVEEGAALPPLTALDGFGLAREPGRAARALTVADLDTAVIGPRHPPGFYGTDTARRALNLGARIKSLAPIAGLPEAVAKRRFGPTRETDIKPWLLLAALVLALVDLVATLALRGLLRPGPAGAVLAGLAFAGLPPPDALAQERDKDAFALEATLDTHLAYVLTGVAEIDDMSRAGLAGLSQTLARRTSIEPADPIAIDIERDEILFFPLLYWPIAPEQPPLGDEALVRVDRFMKNGGTILFDTRDRMGIGSARPGAATDRLRRLLRRLDVPPLTPVPQDHVLTKAFYLMQDFPGRWTGGTVWVERSGGDGNDGVSSIIIGANDWAAAWAVDEVGQPLAAVVPGGERQREWAFRFGVNLVMYALTGNYKADQVHVPALLERLGQ